jgi:hypothetical protein
MHHRDFISIRCIAESTYKSSAYKSDVFCRYIILIQFDTFCTYLCMREIFLSNVSQRSHQSGAFDNIPIWYFCTHLYAFCTYLCITEIFPCITNIFQFDALQRAYQSGAFYNISIWCISFISMDWCIAESSSIWSIL